MWSKKRINGEDISYVVKEKKTYLVGLIDDHVKHVFREYNQEADHLANLEVKGRGKSQLKE